MLHHEIIRLSEGSNSGIFQGPPEIREPFLALPLGCMLFTLFYSGADGTMGKKVIRLKTPS